MNLPDSLVEKLEDSFIRGLPIEKISVESFRVEFRKNPAKYFVSLILAMERDSHEFWPYLRSVLMHAGMNEGLLKQAEEMLEQTK